MSLPSQSARGSVRATAVSTRRRRKSPLRSAMPILVVAALVVVVWFAMRPTGTRTDEPAVPPVGSEAPAEPVVRETPRNVTPPRNTGPGVDAPPRSLPGSREPAPDEVDRVLAADAGRNAPAQSAPTQPAPNQAPPTTPTTTPVSGRQAGETGGVLDRALGGRGGSTGSTDNQTRPTTPAPGNESSRVRMQVETARRLAAENDPVGARALLSRVLQSPGLSASEAGLVRGELTELNNHLLFGRVVDPADPITEEYEVQAGDSLSRIANRRELATHWKLIQRVNGLSDPSKIRLGQKLKLVRGPFHAVVHKSDFRMDVWHGPPSDPSRWVYIRSFDVGLGEDDGTPVGRFVISANKLENPGWVNPRNARERYEPNDPKNPIGEYWLGLDGLGESRNVTGYGIHGTIDPSSVGKNMSMGCVRLRDEDIEVVFELLAERISLVEIVP